MKLNDLFNCFSDPTRLRIINLLLDRQVCVCHIQEVLDAPQVKISKHLSYMRERGLVQAKRHQNWMIYSLSKEAESYNKLLESLSQCFKNEPTYNEDLKKLEGVLKVTSCTEVL